MIKYIKQNQFIFIVGSFIIICSFFYGISAGLRKKSALAYAYKNSNLGFQEENFSPQNISLPQGIEAVSLGRDVRINGKSAEIFSFYTDQNVENVVMNFLAEMNKESVKILLNSLGQKRALLSGVSEKKGKKYFLTIWAVPGKFQDLSARGKKTAGLMEISDLSDAIDSSQSEGLISDVPLMTGGKAGAIFSSLDLDNKRTFTTVYTNPGSIENNLEYYSEILSLDGWKLESSPLANRVNNKIFSNLVFHRKRDELILLLTQSGSETVINITKIETAS